MFRVPRRTSQSGAAGALGEDHRRMLSFNVLSTDCPQFQTNFHCYREDIVLLNQQSFVASMTQPQYLTGQKEAIKDFLSKYDVRFDRVHSL